MKNKCLLTSLQRDCRGVECKVGLGVHLHGGAGLILLADHVDPPSGADHARGAACAGRGARGAAGGLVSAAGGGGAHRRSVVAPG